MFFTESIRCRSSRRLHLIGFGVNEREGVSVVVVVVFCDGKRVGLRNARKVSDEVSEREGFDDTHIIRFASDYREVFCRLI